MWLLNLNDRKVFRRKRRLNDKRQCFPGILNRTNRFDRVGSKLSGTVERNQRREKQVFI